jgi:mxaJ protein
MCSGSRRALVALAIALVIELGGSGAASAAELRVCADPNNLPFSNERLEGFENALAALIAKDLGRTVRYTWWPQRRGFIRSTLGAGRCDVVMGVPSAFELAQTTAPYYRSTYVFVARRDRKLDIRSFDDPRLRELTIGLHAIGDDYSNVPPAQALGARGLAENVRGYSIYGAYSQRDPPRALIDAVALGEVDVAIAWGPLAGYFAQRSKVPLDITPVSPSLDRTGLPMTFEISMGVRRNEAELRSELEQVLERRKSDVRRLLTRFGVPLAGTPAQAHAKLARERP